jgi:capsular polysaccharide transport system permease protein
MNYQTIAAPVTTRRMARPAPFAWLVRHRWFAVVVILPTLLAVIYYGFIASDEYVSQSSFVIRSASGKTPQISTLANLIQTTGFGGGQEQTDQVIDYIRSRDALQDLERRIDIRKKFASRDADFISRYPGIFHTDKFENLFKFYNGKVSATTDPQTGVSQVEVHAFASADAHDINAALLDLSEGLVNRLNNRAVHRSVAEAEIRVTQAEDRVRNARVALSSFRNSQDLIDPKAQAAGVLDVSNKFVAEQAALKAQLDLMLRLTPRNPAIPSLRSRISALGAQIAAQNGRAVGTPTGIASKLSQYEKLQVEQEFATQMLTAANASLEQARTEAQKQQFYLERVVEPNAPDLPLLPNRLKRILTIAGAALCLYFVGWMLIVGILEHAPES